MHSQDKMITIIGSGLSGISAGIYGQMNGYKTRIFEMGHSPGGCCTAWNRNGYTVDMCVHWMIGSGSSSPFYKLGEEVGVAQN